MSFHTKIRGFVILFLALVSSSALQAQDKMLTMDDAIGYNLYPEYLYNLKWVDDEYITYASRDGKEVYLLQVNETQNGRSITYTASQLSDDFYKQYGDSTAIKTFPGIIEWESTTDMIVQVKTNLYRYKTGDRKFELIYEDVPGNPRSIDESLKMAYVEDNDLYVRTPNGSKKITTDGGNGIVYGEAVHRYEFGITKGIFWPKTGNAVAFYRMDESMVTEYPLYNLGDTPATSNSVRYPVAGSKSHHVTIGVYNFETEKLVYLKTGEPKEQYLTNVTWSPDGKIIYVAVLNRGQDHMKLNTYDAQTGEFIQTLFEEKNERYVEPEHGPEFSSAIPGQFVWWSERDGYNHLYLYERNGKLKKQLTKGDWIVTDFHGWSEDGEDIYITATKDSPLERHLYCVNAKSGKMKKLTRATGTHNIKLNASKKHFIDVFSSTVTPNETSINDATGRKLQIIHEAENPIEEYKLGAMEIGSLKADDGTDLYYRVFKPIDFDPTKKYPVVVYLYNGPHLQLIQNRWLGGANLWYQYMAQQGFIVFSIDGRGSANRGFEFESAIHRNCGDQELKDQLEGVNWLAKQGWADTSRMGIHGWSYGGFMTTSMMTRYPGVFNVGVAGGPVIDWKFYEIMYTERYMDSPSENPEGYKKANLINYVDQLEGKLLMIHGGQDATVLWQHSLLYLNATIAGRAQIDYFVYPDHAHNVRGPDRVHLYQKVTDYLIEHIDD